MILSNGYHHAWGSMVDRCGIPGTGPLYQLRKLRGDGTVNTTQTPRDFMRGEDPQTFSASWLQGSVDADCNPYLWQPNEKPQLMTFRPAKPNQPRPRWFTSSWGHGLALFEHGQRFEYPRPKDYWKNDFSIVVECNTANPRTDGNIVWGDPGLGWITISGFRTNIFALDRRPNNTEYHGPDPAHYTLGLIGHVRVAVIVAHSSCSIFVNGGCFYQGRINGVSAPDPKATPTWTGITGRSNNLEGECCGGAFYTRALSPHEAMQITAPSPSCHC